MTQKEIHDSLDAMLANPKSKNFVNHLVKAYFPISNVDKVWDKPEGPFKCVLTKQDLVSVQEILEGIETEQFKTDFKNSLTSILDGEVPKATPMKKLIGDKLLGLTGNKTTTFMSYEAMQEFYNWVLTKSLKGDKHINWLLGSIRRSALLKVTSTMENSEVQEKVKQIEKKENNVSTYTLGETDAFKKLREKFND